MGTIATQDADDVTISGGTISGIDDIAVADGGTGTSNGSITGTGQLTFASGGTDQDINLTPTGTGNTIIKNAVINESANDYSLPTVRGTNGQFLQTDGSGVASWETVANSSLAQMAANTIKGNNTGSASDPIDMTVSDTRTLLNIDNVENTALSTWSGTTSIVELGTISTGTWQADIIGIPYGGTGTSTGSITGTGELTFASGGTNQDINLTPTGTGKTIIKNAVINESANDYSLPTVRGTNGQFLQTDGSGVASWETVANSSLSEMAANTIKGITRDQQQTL